jgi:hypothetical protein
VRPWRACRSRLALGAGRSQRAAFALRPAWPGWAEFALHPRLAPLALWSGRSARTCGACRPRFALQSGQAFLAPRASGAALARGAARPRRAGWTGLALQPRLTLLALWPARSTRARRACEPRLALPSRLAPGARRATGADGPRLAVWARIALLALRAGRTAGTHVARLAGLTGRTLGSTLALRACRPRGPAPHLQRQQDVGGGRELLDLLLADVPHPGPGTGTSNLWALPDAGNSCDFPLVDLAGFGHGLPTPRALTCMWETYRSGP